MEKKIVRVIFAQYKRKKRDFFSSKYFDVMAYLSSICTGEENTPTHDTLLHKKKKNQ